MTNNDRGAVFDEPVVSRTRLELEKRAKKAAHKIAPHFKLYTEQEVTAEIIAELELWSRSLLSSAIVEREKGNDAGADQCKVLQSHIKDRIATLKAKETQL